MMKRVMAKPVSYMTLIGGVLDHASHAPQFMSCVYYECATVYVCVCACVCLQSLCMCACTYVSVCWSKLILITFE